jgi:HK97 family phage major capsid protein
MSTVFGLTPSFRAGAARQRVTTLGAWVPISNEVVHDIAPDVLTEVSETIFRSFALQIDAAAFGATTTNGPSGFGSVTLPTANNVSMGTNGATPTNLDQVSQALQALYTQGVTEPVITMHPAAWGTLTRVKQFTGTITSNAPLVGNDNVNDPQDRRLFGVPVHLSSQMSLTETKGSANNTTSIWIYDPRYVFAPFALGRGGGEPIFMIDPYSQSRYDQTAVRGIGRVGFGFARPESIARISGVIPA